MFSDFHRSIASLLLIQNGVSPFFQKFVHFPLYELQFFSRGTLLFVILLIAVSLSNQEPHSDRVADDIADPETTTPHGCTCSSICGPTVEDGFSVSVMKKRKPFKKYVGFVVGLVLHRR